MNVICRLLFALTTVFTGLFGVHVDTLHTISGNVSLLAVIQDSLDVVVTQSSSYLTPGQELQITVIPNCAVKDRIRNITIAGATVPVGREGIATFKIAAGSLGEHSIAVTASFSDAENNFITRKHTISYIVGQPTVCVALAKMNVLYIGIDNPVIIAASGGDDGKITVNIKGAGSSITKVGAGYYNVRVASLSDDCIISVYIDGRLTGASQFRTRNLPVPLGFVGGHTSGDTVSAASFTVQKGVQAGLVGFPFDITYYVTGYTITFLTDKGEVKYADCQGAEFCPLAKEYMLAYVKPGTTVVIGNLFVKDASDRQIKLSPLIYNIK